MKREAITHTKLKRLCHRLDIPQWQAVGLLEMTWHLTAREAPRGDIGKLSDEDIALALDYRGDSSAMVKALISSGWLDQDQKHRLLVHDWPDHADDATHMKLARHKLRFANGTCPKIGRLPQAERKQAEAFYRLPAQACARSEHGVGEPEPRRSPAPPEPEPVPSSSPSQSHAMPGLAAPEHARDLSPDQGSAAKRGQIQLHSGSASVFVDDDEKPKRPESPKTLSSTGEFAKPKPLDESKPRAFATPTDELKAMVLEKTGKAIEQEVLDEVSSNLGGAVTQEFVDEIKPHIGNNLTNPVGFIRKRSRRRIRPASAPETVKYKCSVPTCGSTVRGEGIRLVNGRPVPCTCASPEYIRKMIAKGELCAEDAAMVPAPAARGSGYTDRNGVGEISLAKAAG